MTIGIASPLMARPPAIPPAGPTGRCRASTVAWQASATRAARRNDIAASGPPSETASTDLIIFSPPEIRWPDIGRYGGRFKRKGGGARQPLTAAFHVS